MTTNHGRRIQGRRALAVLAWISLALLAWLLWYARRHQWIREQPWEPVALLLSAYCAFLAVFSWLLFSPERAAVEESPGIFFGGLLTLIPPCYIAWNLMPVDSPLRGWLTFGVFVFGLIAVLSPMPKDVFAVPRDRKSYLLPVTDAYLTTLDTPNQELDFDSLLPRTEYRLTAPRPVSKAEDPAPPRDPWQDPFDGTGHRPGSIRPARRERSHSSRVAADVRDATAPPPAPVIAPPPLPPIPALPPLPPAVPVIAAPVITSPVIAAPPAPSSAPHAPIAEPRVAESRPTMGFSSRSQPPRTGAPTARPVSEPDEQEVRPGRMSVHELDRQLRDEDDSADSDDGPDFSESGSAPGPAPGVQSSGQLTDGDVSFERIRDEHGGEMIEGRVRVTFAAGEKRAYVHLPFQPPLAGLPDVECEPTDDSNIRVKVAVRQPYGIRLEVRRPDATNQTTTDISFSAIYTPSSRRG